MNIHAQSLGLFHIFHFLCCLIMRLQEGSYIQSILGKNASAKPKKRDKRAHEVGDSSYHAAKGGATWQGSFVPC
jgi:hypothetical protein